MRSTITRTLAALAATATVAVTLTASPAAAGTVITVPLTRPSTGFQFDVDYTQSGTTIGPNTSTVRIILPTQVAKAKVKGLKVSVQGQGASQPAVSIPGGPSQFDVPLSAAVRKGSTIRIDVDSPQRIDPLRRVFTMQNWLSMNVYLKVEPGVTATTSVIDLRRRPASQIASFISYHWGLTNKSVLTVRRGQSVKFVAPTKGFFRTGQDGNAKGTLDAAYGWKLFCAPLLPSGCGYPTWLEDMKVTVSPDGRVATVKFPKTMPLPGKHSPYELIRLTWFDQSGSDTPDSVEIVRRVRLV